ncbi:MAG: class I SAM-dependent methyltransferase [Cyanobacteriota/Melainabacteria group bacterium]
MTLDLNPVSPSLPGVISARSSHGKKITTIEGPALDSIKELSGPLDLVFIDADKGNYLNYYEAVLPLLKSGGIILRTPERCGSGSRKKPRADIAIDVNSINISQKR